MTREEARGLLMRCEAESYCPHYLQKFNCDGCKQRIALDMAIEALSAANLKEKFESAVPNCQKCAIKQLWEETEKEDLVSVVRCKDCRHAGECHKSVQYTRNEPNTVTIGYTKIDFCSHGERREE